jgi:hypothetical protein
MWLAWCSFPPSGADKNREEKKAATTHRSPLVIQLLPPVHPRDLGVELVQRLHDHERLLALDLRNAVDLAPRHQHVLVVQLPLPVPVRAGGQLLVLGGKGVRLLELVLLAILEKQPLDSIRFRKSSLLLIYSI